MHCKLSRCFYINHFLYEPDMGFLSFQLAALNRAHVQFAQLPPPVNTFLFKFSKIFRKPFEQCIIGGVKCVQIRLDVTRDNFYLAGPDPINKNYSL